MPASEGQAGGGEMRRVGRISTLPRGAKAAGIKTGLGSPVNSQPGRLAPLYDVLSTAYYPEPAKTMAKVMQRFKE